MRISRIDLYRLRIPFRFSFTHHAATRSCSDNLVVKITLANGLCGFGEGVPREYVTGETPESALQVAREIYLPAVVQNEASDFPAAVHIADGLPVICQHENVFNAARCAVELALLDAYGKAFGSKVADAKGLLPGITYQGDSRNIGRSGILPLRALFSSRAGVFLQGALFGVRDFKLKWGRLADPKRLALLRRLAGRAESGKISLRIDANGAWRGADLPEIRRCFDGLPLESVEQPFARADLAAFAALMSEQPRFKVTVDESVRTIAELEQFARERLCHRINIRISKMGGFIAALRAVQAAREHGLEYQLGSMVGETGILAAAFDQFLSVVPDVRQAEPSYRRWLLAADPVVRIDPEQPGLGVRINERRLSRFGSLVHSWRAT